jgi:hypothetical protein
MKGEKGGTKIGAAECVESLYTWNGRNIELLLCYDLPISLGPSPLSPLPSWRHLLT